MTKEIALPLSRTQKIIAIRLPGPDYSLLDDAVREALQVFANCKIVTMQIVPVALAANVILTVEMID